MPITQQQFSASPRLVSILERLLTLELKKSLKEHQIDITVEQWRVLFYLWNQDGLTQNQIAAQAEKEKSTITRQINALEKKGLVYRKNSNEDARNKKILLTDYGKELQNHCVSLADEITEKLQMGLSQEEIKQFKKTVNKMISNIQNEHINKKQ